MSKLSQPSRPQKQLNSVSPTIKSSQLSQPAQIPLGAGTIRSHRSSSSASASQRPDNVVASSYSSTSSSLSPSPYLHSQSHFSASGANSARHSHHRQNSASSVKSIKSLNHENEFPAAPIRFPTAPNTGEIIDSFEREQEAIVNKLQKEIAQLKGGTARSRSRSTSSSSSISRHPSTRSAYSFSDTEDHHPNISVNSDSSTAPGKPLASGLNTSSAPVQSVSNRSSRASFSSVTSLSDDQSTAVQTLRKENEALKKKLAELSTKLAEKDKQIEKMKTASN